MGDIDTAMLIEALANRSDPITRFVASLPDEMRRYAEETIQLRREFEINAQRMLSCNNPNESSRYAAWITKHAGEVAYRWSVMLRTVARWSELDTESITFRLRPVSPA